MTAKCIKTKFLSMCSTFIKPVTMIYDNCVPIALLIIMSISLIFTACSNDSNNDKENLKYLSFMPSLMISHLIGGPIKKGLPLPDRYDFGHKIAILPAGSIFDPNQLALPCDILWERDIPVTLRDGTVIYLDVLRPAGSPAKVPAIVAWSPYGKTLPTNAEGNVPHSWFSGIAKFEGPDAAFWVNNGYAIVNVDIRGAYMSEGIIQGFGSVDANDGYDVIEWIAQQGWSNGNIGMHGTSWLAIAEWFIAATSPPHLKAIAPWNGMSDFYRNNIVQGGIPDIAFSYGLMSTLVSPNGIDNVLYSVFHYPLMNDYWDDKRAKVENITIPAYVGSDIATYLHPIGALDAFRRMGSIQKWLRVNITNEWYDQYDPNNEQDLLLFFNHYLKGESNSWESTSKVRVSIMDPGMGGDEKENVEYADWPVPGTEYRKLYLDAANNKLSTDSPAISSSVSYNAKSGETSFTITFLEDTQIVGHLMAHLYVEAKGANDMDMFLYVEKLESDGTPLQPSYLSSTYLPGSGTGIPGQIRVSMRALDSSKSTSYLPVLACTESEKIGAGQVVPVDIAIFPTAMRWHAGQQLRLTISGEKKWGIPIFMSVNKGTHIIHTGGGTASYLQIPVVPWTL